MIKFFACATLVALPAAVAANLVSPADLQRDPASLMPDSTLVYVEAPGLPDLLSKGLEHPLVARLLASPLGDLIRERSPMTPAVALGMLNLYAGQPVLPALARLTSDGIALGVAPSGGSGPVVSVVARGDAQLWREAIELTMTKIAEKMGLEGEQAAQIVRPHRKYRSVDVWALGDEVTFALKDGVFVATNDRDTLRRMIDLGASGEGDSGSLAAKESFALARTSYRSKEVFAWSWIDLETLTTGGRDGMQNLRKLAGQPAPQFLLGPVISSLGTAREGVVELQVDDAGIDVSVTALKVAEGAIRQVLQPLGVNPPDLPRAIAGETARGVFYRDLESIFRHRVELFPTQVQPQFAEVTSNLALFFEGDDITDEVLPGIEPWIGFIAREPEFDARAVPEIPLPGAALLLRVDDPEVMGTRLVTAFQTIVTIINVEAAQNQNPSMMVQVENRGGHMISFARFRRPAEGEGVDMRYNLVPACAMVGDTFVLGSHVSLVREIAEQLARGEIEPSLVVGDSLRLSGARVAAALNANREALVMNSMLNEGKDENQARTEIQALITIAGMIESLALEATRPTEQDLSITLRLTLERGGK